MKTARAKITSPNAVPHETILVQIQLAIAECSKPEYIPACFRSR